jgi:hypothetical protein
MVDVMNRGEIQTSCSKGCVLGVDTAGFEAAGFEADGFEADVGAAGAAGAADGADDADDAGAVVCLAFDGGVVVLERQVGRKTQMGKNCWKRKVQQVQGIQKRKAKYFLEMLKLQIEEMRGGKRRSRKRKEKSMNQLHWSMRLEVKRRRGKGKGRRKGKDDYLYHEERTPGSKWYLCYGFSDVASFREVFCEDEGYSQLG